MFIISFLNSKINLVGNRAVKVDPKLSRNINTERVQSQESSRRPLLSQNQFHYSSNKHQPVSVPISSYSVPANQKTINHTRKKRKNHNCSSKYQKTITTESSKLAFAEPHQQTISKTPKITQACYNNLQNP